MPMPMTPGVPVMALTLVWPGVAGNGDSYLDYNSILPLRTLLVSCPDCPTNPSVFNQTRSVILHISYEIASCCYSRYLQVYCPSASLPELLTHSVRFPTCCCCCYFCLLITCLYLLTYRPSFLGLSLRLLATSLPHLGVLDLDEDRNGHPLHN